MKDSKPEATAVQSLPICEAPDNNEEEDMDMEIVVSFCILPLLSIL